MFIPLGVDVPMERRPFVNWLLVAVMSAIFAWQTTEPIETTQALCLHGFFSKGLFTHMWIHADILHLVGNMIFLWVFGNAVCYKLGNLLYAPAFFIFGIISALFFSIFCSVPMLGASGAINGIVGMYLVFFPINDITCLWIFGIFFRKFSLSSYWMILFWLVFDILGAMSGDGFVAYWAHLGGFIGGFGIATALVKTGFIEPNRYEKTLYDLIADRKNPPVLKTSSATQSYADYLNEQARSYDEKPAEDSLKIETVEPIPAAIPPKPPKAKTKSTPVASPLAPKPNTQPKPGFIRFKCACGMPIKTPIQHAGRTGKCPKCKARITIPSQ